MLIRFIKLGFINPKYLSILPVVVVLAIDIQDISLGVQKRIEEETAWRIRPIIPIYYDILADTQSNSPKRA